MWKIGHNRFPRIYIGKRTCDENLLNFLKLDEITEPVMRGIDANKRKFLIVKYLVEQFIFVDIYLQETPLWENRWIVCGNITPNVFAKNTYLTNNQIAFIENIIMGKILKLNENHGLYNNYLKERNIRLYNK